MIELGPGMMISACIMLISRMRATSIPTAIPAVNARIATMVLRFILPLSQLLMIECILPFGPILPPFSPKVKGFMVCVALEFGESKDV